MANPGAPMFKRNAAKVPFLDPSRGAKICPVGCPGAPPQAAGALRFMCFTPLHIYLWGNRPPGAPMLERCPSGCPYCR